MAQVQTKTASTAAKTAGTITATNNYGVGNTVVIISEDNFGDGVGTQIGTILDGVNTWRRAAGASDGNNVDCEIWYAYNVTAAHPPGTITYRNTVSSSIILAEYSGLLTTDPLDKTISAVGTSTSPASGNTPTLSQKNETILGVVGFGGVNTGTASSPVTGYGTIAQEDNGSGNKTNSAIADKQVSATTAQSIGMTLSLSNEWVAFCATFKNRGAGNNLIQSTGTAALGLGAGTVTFPSNITAGNLVLVGVTVTNVAVLGTVGTVTDTVGNTYKKAVGGTISELTSVIDEEIWYAPITTGGTGVLTVTHTTDNAAIYAREYSGGYNAVDVVGSAVGSSTAPNTGTATTGYTDLLIVSTGDDHGAGQTYTAGGIYGDSVGTTTTLTGLGMQDGTATAGAQTGTLSLGAAANWVSCFASFYGSAASSAVGYKSLLGVGQI